MVSSISALIWATRAWMSAFLPAPSTMVVFSLSIVTFLGDGDLIELYAEIFRDRLAASEDGDVLQHGLAAIAEAGAFHRRDLEPARGLFTTRVANASPSTSSATISSGLPVCTTASSSGSSS